MLDSEYGGYSSDDIESDYERMTDDELRAEIARRLGWRIVRQSEQTGYFLADGEDNIHFGCYEHDLLTVIERYGPFGMLKMIPNWPQDVNAALKLCDENHICLAQRVIDNTPRWYAMIDPRLDCQYVGWSDGKYKNPYARAITIAKLRWLDKSDSHAKPHLTTDTPPVRQDDEDDEIPF